MGTSIDFLSEEYRARPYSAWDEARETGEGIHFQTMLPVWSFTRYEDVSAILRDPRRFSSNFRLPGTEDFGGPGDIGRLLLFADPPVHTKIRKLLSRAFTIRSIEELRPRVEQIADGLLDGFAADGEVDLVEAFTAPLPLVVIAEMLGIPAEDSKAFSRWSDAVTEATSPMMSPDVKERARREVGELHEYFLRQIEERRQEPGEDLLTRLVAAEVDGERLTGEEIAGTAILLLAAGNETSRTLLTNAVAMLLDHPDQLEKLRQDQGLVPTMVEEALRMGPPLAMTFRRTTEPVEIGPASIPPDWLLLLSLAAANRDPREFPHADQFDVTRNPNRHIAFSTGIHLCLGAPLARLEAQVAIPKLIARYPDLARGATSPQYRIEVHTPGYATYPVTV